MKTKSNITTLDQILDKVWEKGAPKREEREQQFEAFHLAVLLEEG